ncbi:MAG: Nif3-like dinuclear metal center hexameric protein [Desulfovibrionaceae bacterium]|nr:Nif3-like dinuclear metal center hexameric protein [Desulfovibrionaceae bacterium]
MKINDLIKIIEKIAPLSLAESWDKSGMQVASHRQKITHLAVTLEPLPQNISQALEIGADFLLAHHPLALQPRFPDQTDSYHSVLSMLFKADLPLYSAHTSMDCNPLGPARWLAHSFKLRRPETLAKIGRAVLPGFEEKGEQDYGPGFVGDLPSPIAYAEFCHQLAGHTGSDNWRSSGPEVEIVARLACCPGSGGDLAEKAMEAGAQVFISGDIRYHAALTFGLRVIDLGHFSLEESMMKICASKLADMLPEIKVSFIPGRDPFTIEPY